MLLLLDVVDDLTGRNVSAMSNLTSKLALFRVSTKPLTWSRMILRV